jgi:aminopeptidase N
MIHTLLGEAGFQRGMKLYFDRHDGQAVTCDDFVSAMQDASGVDLAQFRRWYEQAGTPRVTLTTRYDEAARAVTLDLAQETPPTPGQPALGKRRAQGSTPARKESAQPTYARPKIPPSVDIPLFEPS